MLENSIERALAKAIENKLSDEMIERVLGKIIERAVDDDKLAQIIAALLEHKAPAKGNARQQAMLAGEIRYYTGFPCTRGHVAERYTKTAQCVECSRGYYYQDRRRKEGGPAPEEQPMDLEAPGSPERQGQLANDRSGDGVLG